MSQNRNVSGTVAVRENNQSSTLIEQYKGDLATVMPSHVRPDVFVRLAVGVLNRDEKLARAAANNPLALIGALMEAARLGLEPGTEQYYLTPRYNGKSKQEEIAGIRGYQGEIELIYRAGAVSSVIVESVREGDVFAWTPGELDQEVPARWHGPQTQPYHKVDWFGERGALKGVYSYAIMKDGAISKVCVLNRAKVMEAKAMSKGSDGSYSPWQTSEEAMWLKTAAHRLTKWVPTSAEYMREQLRAVAVVQAEQAAPKAGVPGPRQASPVEQRTEDEFRAMANDASGMDELSRVLREAQQAGFAQQGDPLFAHFVARRNALEAQGGNEVALGHDHDGDFDADCEACRAEQAKLDQQMAGAS